MNVHSKSFKRREVAIATSSFVAAAFLFIAGSALGTSIGTDVTVTGDLYATSTVQATGNILGFADLFIGGTSTQSLADVAIGGAAGTNADVFISGGLGVANATTSDGDLIVGTGSAGGLLSFTANGRLVVGATSTALSSTGAPNKFVFDGGAMLVSSGGTGTTTLSIVNEAGSGAGSTGGCIELSKNGSTYRIFINAAEDGLTVQAGSCGGN